MKISKQEAQAAISVYYDSGKETAIAAMREALEAAYTVRKARKAAKRAKAKPSILDEDQQEALGKPEQPEHRFKVGDRVMHEVFGGVIIEVDNQLASYCVKFDDGGVGWVLGRSITPEPAKPEWNGKFEVGKAYRTRAGERAEIEGILSGSYHFHGYVGNKSNGRVWTECGKILDGFEFNHADDIIVPWVD